MILVKDVFMSSKNRKRQTKRTRDEAIEMRCSMFVDR
jgi:hypothetical protein